MQACHIYKSFNSQQVLSDVSLSFKRGAISVLIGKSGGGKTVLLKILLGLLVPDAGHVMYEGVDFFMISEGKKKAIRKKMGMVFQNAALFDSLNVQENLLLPMNLLTRTTKKEKLCRVDEVLERVNLRGVNDKFPSELSGGMQKRVAIARALVLKPKFFFCDEPNSGLDPQTSIVIDQLIKDLTVEYNMTTIVVSHDMNSVMEIANYIYFLENGRITWQGTQDDLANTTYASVEEYVFASQMMRQVKKYLSQTMVK